MPGELRCSHRIDIGSCHQFRKEFLPVGAPDILRPPTWPGDLEELKDWRRGSESNRRIKVLQTSPLPLGYRAPAPYVSVPAGKSPSAEGRLGTKKLERETGVEPATSTLARSRSTTELLPLDSKIIPHLRFAEPMEAMESASFQLDSDPSFESAKRGVAPAKQCRSDRSRATRIPIQSS